MNKDLLDYPILIKKVCTHYIQTHLKLREKLRVKAYVSYSITTQKNATS